MPAINFAQYATRAPSDKLAGIVMLYTAASFFMKFLQFEITTEFTKGYDTQATLGGIGFRSLNEQYTPDAGVINPAAEVLKIFGGSVQTDRLLASGPNGKAYRNNNIASKVKKAGQFFDKMIIKGNSTTNPKEFDGLEKRLTGNQVLSMGANGAQLTLARVDDLLDATIGTNSGKAIVTNKQVRTQMKRLILASAGGAAVAEFKNGEIESYNGARIAVVDGDDRELPILAFDEAQGTDPATCSMYCLRAGEFDGENVRGLVRKTEGSEPIQYVDYGERNGVYDELVEAVMGLAIYNGKSAARLKGIKIPA